MRWPIIIRGTPNPSGLLGWLVLVALVVAIAATVLAVGWDRSSALAGYVQFFAIIAAVLLAVLAVVARSLGARRVSDDLPPGIERLLRPARATAAGPGRVRVARLLAVLALVCLAVGSTVVASLMTWVSVAWVAGKAGEDPGLAVAIFFFATWPPTFVLTWAFGTLALMAKGTLDPVAAVLALVAGSVGSMFVLLPVSAVPGGAILALAALNVAAIRFVTREFWAHPQRPAGVARPRTTLLA